MDPPRFPLPLPSIPFQWTLWQFFSHRCLASLSNNIGIREVERGLSLQLCGAPFWVHFFKPLNAPLQKPNRNLSPCMAVNGLSARGPRLATPAGPASSPSCAVASLGSLPTFRRLPPWPSFKFCLLGPWPTDPVFPTRPCRVPPFLLPFVPTRGWPVLILVDQGGRFCPARRGCFFFFSLCFTISVFGGTRWTSFHDEGYRRPMRRVFPPIPSCCLPLFQYRPKP